ncbi:sulfatase [Luteolibacter yonseiensis]|uniref:Sulfatase n=1 Tax=Luteolibacter yonseiensis TaxID=1144680 RepID=A0A934R083_9BACT|nr:sulfatase [Luteolibacter yonseiensis]MBK1814097.1 sulfatase [Luteolibacter yonseiensis]
MKLAGILFLAAASFAMARPPNVVVIFNDDMAYADVACFGAKYATPNIDRLAKEGRRFTNFHVSSPVCSASRASLLTGCYNSRIGIHGALGPKARIGLNPEETTLAELVKQKGYATGMAGKWHLGDAPEFLPVKQGFDEWYGLPYSNDMWPHHPEAKKGTYPKLPMYENDRIVDEEVTPDDQKQLTTRYAARAVSFIERNKDRPFFFYLANSMPHVPLYVSDKFAGKSGAGLYGDVIQEIDWGVGQVMEALEKAGVADNTLVIFTSDNGPWLSYGDHAGNAAPLREGKGTAWEGGTRVPTIMRWPGRIPAGTESAEMAMTTDLFPTIAAIIGAELPKVGIDGSNRLSDLTGEPNDNPPPRRYAWYYENNKLLAVADGDWKLMLPQQYRTMADAPQPTGGIPGKYQQRKLEKPMLFDLKKDIGEQNDVAAAHPEIVEKLLQQTAAMRADLGDSQTGSKSTGAREPGRVSAN